MYFNGCHISFCKLWARLIRQWKRLKYNPLKPRKNSHRPFLFFFFASLRRVKNHISEILCVCPYWLLKGTSNSAVTSFIYHCLPALQSIIVFLPHISKDLIPRFLKKLGGAGLWKPYPDNGTSRIPRECWELLLIICATSVQLTAL